MSNQSSEAAVGEPRQLRSNVMGTPSLAFTVIATVGPLAAFMGAAPLVFMTVGAGATFMYLLAMILMLLFAVGYLAMSRKMGNASGFILFISKGLGRTAGVSAAMVTLVTYAVFIAGLYGVYTVFVQQAIVEFFGVEIPWGILAIALVALSALLAYNRVEFSIRIMGVLLILAMISILVLDVAILIQVGGEGALSFAGFAPTSIVGAGFGLAALFALGSFGGVESTVVFSEEAKEPRRTIPRAMYVVIAALGLFYVISTWAVGNAVGAENVLEVAGEDPTGFILVVASEYVAPFWAQILNILVVTSFFAVVLGFTNMANRYVFALGRAGILPQTIGRSHKRHQSPHIASLVTAAIVLLIILGFIIAGAHPFDQMYTWLFAIGAVGVLVLMCASSLAVVIAFRRNPDPEVNIWTSTIAPLLSFLGFAAAVVIAILNFSLMAGGSGVVEWLWVLLVIAAAVGAIMGSFPRFKNARLDNIE